ncbi:MAG: hypothetical protein EXR81_02215 [Gammaproteobacteria bacterium]|nr:hypothetical protein [Gammaproteobacteria bacterium]
MKRRNTTGIIITLIFSMIAFLLALYAIFSPSSFAYHANDAWLIAIFSLGSILISLRMFKAKTGTVTAMNVLLIILAGIMALLMSLYWILICLIISLIGCIVYKAGKLS